MVSKVAENTAIVSANVESLANGSNDFRIPNGFICTLDLTSIKGKLTLANALNTAESLRDMVGVPIAVTDFVTTEGTRSQTGEKCVNTYLIAEDGKVYFTQSDGIASSVKILVGIFTNQQTGEFVSPVSCGVNIVVREVALRNGNTLKRLECISA